MMPVRPVDAALVQPPPDALLSIEVRAPPKLDPRRWLRRDVSHVTTQLGRVAVPDGGVEWRGGVAECVDVAIVANTTLLADVGVVCVGRLALMSAVVDTGVRDAPATDHC